MMFEKDVREKIICANDGRKVLNPYWEGLLDSQKKAFLSGYDIATENCDSAFDALREEVEDAPVKNTFAQDVIDDTQGFVTNSIERNRQEFVVALVEEMDDSEFEKNYETAFAETLKEEPDLCRFSETAFL